MSAINDVFTSVASPFAFYTSAHSLFSKSIRLFSSPCFIYYSTTNIVFARAEGYFPRRGVSMFMPWQLHMLESKPKPIKAQSWHGWLRDVFVHRTRVYCGYHAPHGKYLRSYVMLNTCHHTTLFCLQAKQNCSSIGVQINANSSLTNSISTINIFNVCFSFIT